MRLFTVACFSLLLGQVVLGAAPSAVTIKGVKKTEGSRSGDTIGPVRTIERKQDDVYYQFNLMTMSPSISSNVTVQWVVLVTTQRGRLRLASQGKEAVTLPMARTVSVETPIFTMNESRGPKGHKAESEIFGYGVRVYDASGQLISEAFDPASAQKRLEEAFAGKL